MKVFINGPGEIILESQNEFEVQWLTRYADFFNNEKYPKQIKDFITKQLFAIDIDLNEEKSMSQNIEDAFGNYVYRLRIAAPGFDTSHSTEKSRHNKFPQ